jgi:hypothetical protein
MGWPFYVAGMFCRVSFSISRHISQRSEVGLFKRRCITTRGYCLQSFIQCHRSGSAPFTYSYSFKSKPTTINSITHQIFLICVTTTKNGSQIVKLSKKTLSSYPLHLFKCWTYFDLPAFLAQASLQYFDLALNVVYGFLQTGHFFSIQISSQYQLYVSLRTKKFFVIMVFSLY